MQYIQVIDTYIPNNSPTHYAQSFVYDLLIYSIAIKLKLAP